MSEDRYTREMDEIQIDGCYPIAQTVEEEYGKVDELIRVANRAEKLEAFLKSIFTGDVLVINSKHIAEARALLKPTETK